MSVHYGDVPVGSTIYHLFDSYDSNGASVIVSSFAVTDIEIYKDGGTTQRASDAGYTLLDTDGINFDSITGIHGFSIDLSDDTDSGFFAAGSWYTVVVDTITIDSQSVSFIACSFTIKQAGNAIQVLSDVDSALTSQFTIIEDFASDIYSDTTLLVTNLAAVDQDTSDIKSALDSQFAIIEDFASDTYSHLVVTDAVVDTIYSDTTIVETAIGAGGSVEDALSDIYSHLVVTDAVVDTIYSDTTLLVTNVAVIDQDTSDLKSAMDSQFVIIEDFVSDIYSDTTAITGSRAEPGQGAPAATTDVLTKIDYLYQWTRNKKDNDGSTTNFYEDDGSTVAQTQATSESGGTVTKGEIASGA